MITFSIIINIDMQKDGLKALVFGSTGAIGAVFISLHSNWWQICLLLRLGQVFSVWQEKVLRNGTTFLVNKN